MFKSMQMNSVKSLTLYLAPKVPKSSLVEQMAAVLEKNRVDPDTGRFRYQVHESTATPTADQLQYLRGFIAESDIHKRPLVVDWEHRAAAMDLGQLQGLLKTHFL